MNLESGDEYPSGVSNKMAWRVRYKTATPSQGNMEGGGESVDVVQQNG